MCINNKTKPLKSLTFAYKRFNGRNNTGHITMWHRGGQHKRLYRNLDLQRKNTNGIVTKIEYDPNRKASIARIFNPDIKIYKYILAPTQLKIGDVIRSNSKSKINGHSLKLKYITTGSIIHNISAIPGARGKFLRAPGAFGRLIKKTLLRACVQLKSGSLKWFNTETLASLGTINNLNQNKKLYKSGQSRWLGRRPKVRGVAMNPVDHPHGGGEGKTSGGRPSVTPWGKS
uniref:ribosomal protein L2 n=1 Tax=Dictyotopsis propagulifera TaxID=670095 RepID=UPI002E7761E9|nr:ribosomal protein L2 [Dictyotopsis propagulifera]WBP69954.1 ribosomal protein L2 [Dictyotopsis propagulifera]